MNIMNLSIEPQKTERFIHSFKTALACLLGFAVAKLTHFRTEQWLIITTLVVMCAQINVGSVIQKSYMRFLGTLTGSVLAILTLQLFGANTLASIVVVTLSAVFFSYLATSDKSYSDSGTLGAVTVCIILIGQNPTVTSGIERCIEISIGILIAALVSQFIFPIHAKRHLRDNQAKTIRQLRSFYLQIFSSHTTEKTAEELQILDENISKSLIVQRKLAGEAKRENFKGKFNANFFTQCLRCEKEIMRSIIFMSHAYQASDGAKKIVSDLDLFKDFHKQVSHALEEIAVSIETRKNQIISLPEMTPLKNALQKEIELADDDLEIQLCALLFCAETLVNRLDRVVVLLKSVNSI
ncbi:MAG: FUSC family protein [Gammaproteobacteria bacterium]